MDPESRNYDVFISFRGADTRKKFIGHLYTALTGKINGIKVFLDDRELEIGKPIPSELLDATEKSRISIVVFSRNYCSSSWCLDELVNIVKCKKTGQVVIPIFYDVDPWVERENRGYFEKSFAEHEEKFRDNIKKVETWRNTLMEVINLPGWELKERYESELIKDVVKEIRKKLSGSTSTSRSKLVVGVNSCLEKLRIQAERMNQMFQWGRFPVAPALTSFFFFKSTIGFYSESSSLRGG